MQVSKWGNSLAVRLPAAVVEALELKEGDQIEVRIAGPREFEITRDRSRDAALELMTATSTSSTLRFHLRPGRGESAVNPFSTTPSPARAIECCGIPFKPGFGLSGIPQHSTANLNIYEELEKEFFAKDTGIKPPRRVRSPAVFSQCRGCRGG